MKTLAILALILVAGVELHATPVKRLFQDVKLPTQKVFESESLTAPVTASTTRILSAVAGPTSAAAKVVTTFAAQPDVPRNLTVIAGNSSVDLNSCVVTVKGTDYNSHSISETFTFTANTLATKTGSRAFKTVTEVDWPASCEGGSFATTWSVGVATKIGLSRCLAQNADYLFESVDGAADTLGTQGTNPNVLSLNYVALHTAPNASHNYVLYFLQNYNCLN